MVRCHRGWCTFRPDIDHAQLGGMENRLHTLIGDGTADREAIARVRGRHPTIRHRAKGRARPRLAVPLLIILLFVSACGEAEPAGVTEPASMPAQGDTVSPPAGGPGAASGQDAAGTNGTSPAELTLGEVVDRINAQLTGFDSFREVSASSVSATTAQTSSPVAATPAGERSQRTVREVMLPDRVRYTAELDGQLEYELIVIGDRVFARGSVATLLDPTAPTGEWIQTDLATVAASPMLGEAAAQQLTNLDAPRYAVPDRLRPQPVRLLDPVSVDGVRCETYGAADTTASGARIDLTFAIDDEDRLCFVETEAIGISSRYTIEMLDDAFRISPPAEARVIATPVASPTLKATPVSITTPAATP